MDKNTLSTKLETINITPLLVITYVFNLDCSNWKFEKFEKRTIEYYEFEYILQSEGYMFLEGKKYPLKPGDICFKRPGEITQGIMPYSCFMVSFKLSAHQVPYQNYQNEILDKLPPIYSTKNKQYYELIFKQILDEYLKGNPVSSIKIKSSILDLIYSLYEEVQQNYLPSSPYYSVINKAIKYIENNYQNKILLDDISSYINMSSFHFHKIFKQTMQISPNEYLMNHRVRVSKELLMKTNESITDIAFKCGFESSSYFCFVFKQKMNVSPNKYRKLHSIF